MGIFHNTPRNRARKGKSAVHRHPRNRYRLYKKKILKQLPSFENRCHTLQLMSL
jgi:hypothetical protein